MFNLWLVHLPQKTVRLFGKLSSQSVPKVFKFNLPKAQACRSQWPRDLRFRSAVARLLRLWVRIPPVAWMSVCCDCRVLSGRGLCDELITRPEESYRLCCLAVCDLETSWMRRPWPTGGLLCQKQTNKYLSTITHFSSWDGFHRLWTFLEWATALSLDRIR